MSTLRVNTIQDQAGTGQPTIEGLARAWVNFNGTGTVAIRAALNVTSITDNGTGNYTVNITSALADSSYSAVTSASSGGANVSSGAVPSSTTVCTIYSWASDNGTVIDSSNICVAIFR